MLNHVRKLMPVVLEETLHRHRRRIAQRANGLAADATGDAIEQIQIKRFACC